MNAVLDVEKMVPAWQALKSLAPLAHMESEADYKRTTAFLNELLDEVRSESKQFRGQRGPGSPFS